MRGQRIVWMLSALLAVALLTSCSSGEEPPAAGAVTEQPEEAELAARDPGEPFGVDEQGIVTLTNDQAYDIRVQRENGEPLFEISFKESGVIDPSVRFAVQTVPFEMPAELTDAYVAVVDRAFELHAVDEQGYGFALRPELKVYFAEDEIAAAQQEGAALDTLQGNLLVLYKEQRSPKWVPQTSVSIDEENNVVTVSNVAGAGAWTLVAKKAP